MTHDWFAELTMYAAWLAIAFVITAFIFETRNRWRKNQRDRLVASINSRMAETLFPAPDLVLADLENLVDSHFSGNPELEEKLKGDLQSLAILSIIDDRVIPKTALSVRDRLQNPDDLKRWLTFVADWVQAAERTPLDQLNSDEARRGRYEYEKKKRMLGRELQAADA